MEDAELEQTRAGLRAVCEAWGLSTWGAASAAKVATVHVAAILSTGNDGNLIPGNFHKALGKNTR